MRPVDGRQLRAARAILGWTSAQAAEAAGLHRNAVSNVEGRRVLPLHTYAGDRLGEAFEREGIQFTVGEDGPVVTFSGPRYRTRRKRRSTSM